MDLENRVRKYRGRDGEKSGVRSRKRSKKWIEKLRQKVGWEKWKEKVQ